MIEALRNQVTSVPTGADVGFTCKSTTDAVWIRESSTSFVETKFLSQGAEPFDEQIDLNKYSFGKKGNKYSLIIKDVQLSDAGESACVNACTLRLLCVHCLSVRLLCVNRAFACAFAVLLIRGLCRASNSVYNVHVKCVYCTCNVLCELLRVLCVFCWCAILCCGYSACDALLALIKILDITDAR